MSIRTGIPLRDLLEIYTARDLATVLDILEEGKPAGPVGVAQFNE